MKETVLTGIKPTGLPHIGNYFGAIKPSIELSHKSQGNSFYFIANYHALNQIKDANLIKDYTLRVAATWLACGLDPSKVVFYKQGDVPEVFELFSILTNVTPKGLMNRAHAYKAITDKNIAAKADVDSGVNMGLYNYPILMAADILLFNTKFVPVGEDQRQHVEIARDIAHNFNNTFGQTFTLPEALIDKNLCEIEGIDGRKMSKSYNNELPLFATDEQIKKYVSRITTDSSLPTDPKPVTHAIFELYKLVATEQEITEFKKRFNSGIGWGDAKAELTSKLQKFIKPIREKYEYNVSNPKIVEDILTAGAEKAKIVAKETIRKVKSKIGM